MTDKRSRPSWDEYFLNLTREAASRSPDPNTQVGCVIVRDKRVLATGYNGNIAGVDTSNFPWIREKTVEWPNAKYPLVMHAELNCVAQAAKEGISLKDSTAYVFFMPCLPCLQLLWQVGVREIVFPKGKTGTESKSFGLERTEDKPYYDLIFRATKGQLVIREV